MKRTRQELKAELMAQMEEEIDRLLDWHERTEAPTLAEIEDAVLELRKRMGQRMAGSWTWNAEEILEKVGQISISDSSIWHQVQQWSEDVRAIAGQERVRANVLPGRWGHPSQARAPQGRMGVAVDGSMIHPWIGIAA